MKISGGEITEYTRRLAATTDIKAAAIATKSDDKICTVGFSKDVSDIDYTDNIELLTKLTLESLKNAYKNVDIYSSFTEFADRDAITLLARQLSGKKSLVVSDGFIKHMTKDADSFYAGKMILEEVLGQLSANEQRLVGAGAYVDQDGATFWSEYLKTTRENSELSYSPPDKLEEMRQKMEEIRNKFKVKLNKSIYDAPAEMYARLARAASIPDVKGVISASHRRIFSLKSALTNCEDDERAKLRATLGQLEKAVSRARRKITNLTDENSMQIRRKNAEKQHERRKAEQIKAELEKKRTVRRAREKAQQMEGQQWFYYPQDIIATDKKYDDLQITTQFEYNSVFTPLPATAALPIAAPTQISVSATIDISI